MEKINKIIYIGLAPIIIVPVWAAGGTYKPWQGSFVYLAFLAWISYSVWRHLLLKDKKIKPQPVPLWKDVWVGISFLWFVYAIIQWKNTGRIQVFDFDTNQYTYSLPPISWLPWSFTSGESFEMISWFLPVLTSFHILRKTWNFISLRVLLWIVCINGMLNALLAFTHLKLHWVKMYNFQKFGDDVYGSFGYPNHGAMYFLALMALTLGVFLTELSSEKSERKLVDLWFFGIGYSVFFIAANLSSSRAGILGSWMVSVCAILSILTISWPRIHIVQKLYTIYGIIGGVVCMAGLFWFTAGPMQLQELRDATVDLNVIEESGRRFIQIPATINMIIDHPWFGVGGWGNRYLISKYLPQEKWHLLGVGQANTHNDFLQFLVEFGLVGFSLILLPYLPFIFRIGKGIFLKVEEEKSVWSTPLKICCFWGVAALLADSTFDIPFRSPAVTIHFVILLFCIMPHKDIDFSWGPSLRRIKF